MSELGFVGKCFRIRIRLTRMEPVRQMGLELELGSGSWFGIRLTAAVEPVS
jgi:hypothetical protein